MRRKLILISLICLWIFICPFSTASAHVLIEDQNIGAILHINPDDDPIAGQESTFFLEFKDRENKFQPQNCNCTFSVIENGTTIDTQPLFQDSQNPSGKETSTTFTFPQKDVYQVKITGAPRTKNAFQAFTLIYNVRVDRTAQNSTTPNERRTFFPILIFGIIIIGIGSISALIYRKKYAKKN